MPILSLTRPSNARVFVATEFIEWIEHSPNAGSIIHTNGGSSIEVLERPDDLFEVSPNQPFYPDEFHVKSDA